MCEQSRNFKTVSLCSLLAIIFMFIINFNLVNADSIEMQDSREPFETVATYKASDVSTDTLSLIKKIASADNTVTMEIKDGNLIIRRIYLGNSTIKDVFSPTFIPFLNQNIKIINFNSALEKMDRDNGETNISEGDILTRSYKGQTRNGEHVSVGTHVHCNRFNGNNSDHRYWTHSDARSWSDFYYSDCDRHLMEYGCVMSGNSKCDGLNRKGNGVHDCSSWNGGPYHKNWPKTCWYRN
jgi:hypothetical protein